MIEVKNLVKDYGKHHAVKDISFSVPDGQIVGLLGPNGAGKSTTMNIMTGYISATSGEVKIGGYDILEQPLQAKKLIGYLPEIPPLYEDMTVEEYLNFICDLKGIRKKTEKESSINEVTEAVKISDMKKRLIKNLSKGYKQRVGLAQALIGNPPLLILDEPTVGLDPNQIIEIRSLIKSLGEKHTIILSSHILSEVSQICNRVIIINKGKIVAIDTPENLENKVIENNVVYVTVEDPENKMNSVKEKLDNVTSIELVSENEDKTKKYIIKGERDIDLRKEIFETLSKEGITIFEMKKADATLEDAFMKLINDSTNSNNTTEENDQENQNDDKDEKEISEKENKKEDK